jgi:hypothetical protein
MSGARFVSYIVVVVTENGSILSATSLWATGTERVRFEVANTGALGLEERARVLSILGITTKKVLHSTNRVIDVACRGWDQLRRQTGRNRITIELAVDEMHGNSELI